MFIKASPLQLSPSNKAVYSNLLPHINWNPQHWKTTSNLFMTPRQIRRVFSLQNIQLQSCPQMSIFYESTQISKFHINIFLTRIHTALLYLEIWFCLCTYWCIQHKNKSFSLRLLCFCGYAQTFREYLTNICTNIFTSKAYTGKHRYSFEFRRHENSSMGVGIYKKIRKISR